jgi:thiol-disulfide isomerase/thioredoxin
MSSNRSTVITISVLLIIIILAYCYTQNVLNDIQQDIFDSSPAATVLGGDEKYTDIDGNPISMNDYLGKNVVALTWASWCAVCKDQLKLFTEVAIENSEVVVLAFNRAESADKAKDYLSFYNIDTTITIVLDPNDAFFTGVNGFAMPETVIFDETGEISFHKRGPITKQELESQLTNK